eukprot:163421-Chlamydomonas_euryale.AAC.2
MPPLPPSSPACDTPTPAGPRPGHAALLLCGDWRRRALADGAGVPPHARHRRAAQLLECSSVLPAGRRAGVAPTPPVCACVCGGRR